jgi:hypothetical protein
MWNIIKSETGKKAINEGILMLNNDGNIDFKKLKTIYIIIIIIIIVIP